MRSADGYGILTLPVGKRNIAEMYCPFCGIEVGEEFVFCPSCGRRLPNKVHGVAEEPIRHQPVAQNEEVSREHQVCVSPLQALIWFFTRWTFDGRSSRSEVWWVILFVRIPVLLISLFVWGAVQSPFTVYLGLILFVPTMFLQVRRFHDIERSVGWLYALYIVDLVHALLQLVLIHLAWSMTNRSVDFMQSWTFLLWLVELVFSGIVLCCDCYRSKPHANKYGPVPNVSSNHPETRLPEKDISSQPSDSTIANSANVTCDKDEDNENRVSGYGLPLGNSSESIGFKLFIFFFVVIIIPLLSVSLLLAIQNRNHTTYMSKAIHEERNADDATQSLSAGKDHKVDLRNVKTDFSQMSDEELEQVANGSGAHVNFSRMSDEELEHVVNGGIVNKVNNAKPSDGITIFEKSEAEDDVPDVGDMKRKAADERFAIDERFATERKAKESATKIRLEARVQHGKVARISDADGFKARKDSLEDIFARAEALYDETSKRWAEAEALYRDYIQQSVDLISLDGERQVAVAKRSAMQASFKKAEESGARVYATKGWKAAFKTRYGASAEFDKMKFTTATKSFAKALREFDECAETARNNKQIAKEKQAKDLIEIETLRREVIGHQVAQELDAARGAMFSRNWDAAYKNYRLAFAHMEERTDAEVQKYRKECVTGMAQAKYESAILALRNGDRETAKRYANEAQKLRHPQADALINAIKTKNPR